MNEEEEEEKVIKNIYAIMKSNISPNSEAVEILKAYHQQKLSEMPSDGVMRYAKLMQKELDVNEPKKGHWGELDIRYLAEELIYHAEKLRDSMVCLKGKDKIIEYAADCGNLGMMIVDNLLTNKTEK